MEGTEHHLDPLLFCILNQWGGQDAAITLLYFILKALSGLWSSWTFSNTSIVDFGAGWILDFLTCRSQSESERTLLWTNSLQGNVLSPLLYVQYTSDCCREIENHHFVKFADDPLQLCQHKINGQDVEISELYKCFATIIDMKLSLYAV